MAKTVITQPRPRRRGTNNVSRVATAQSVHTYYGPTVGTYTTVTKDRLGGYRGEHSVCLDVVTPNYAAVRNAGQIVNNPFYKVEYICDFGGSGPNVQHVGSTSPWPVGGAYNGNYPGAAQLNWNSAFQLPPVIDTLTGDPVVPQSVYDLLAPLLRGANTQALSKVDQGNAQGLVGIGELKHTLATLKNPLSSIAQYLSRWRFVPIRNGRKLIVRDGKGLLPSVTNQYLELYYGLMPTVRDVESYLDAYINSGTNPLRSTARGRVLSLDESVTVVNGNRNIPVGGDSGFDTKRTVKTELMGRSGILYTPTPNCLQKALGLRWGDALPAAYELMPWSFFIDYFSNLGTLIEALTPRIGVSYLASWECAVIQQTERIEVTDTFPPPYYVHNRKGTEWAERTLRASIRTPKSPFSGIGFVPKYGTWEDKAKVGAVLALIMQQIGSRVIPRAIWDS